MRNFFARLLLFVGFLSLLLFVALVYKRYRPNPLAFNGRVIVKAESTTSELSPVFLSLPSLGIRLPVTKAKIHGTTWETTDEGVSYLASSPMPGSRGNSIFYGHNWPNLLGKLPNTKPGDSIEVTLSNGERKKFVVEYVTIVTPEQTKILENSSDVRLTLYTCTGFLDSKRFVVTALLQ